MADVALLEQSEIAKLKILYADNVEKLEAMMWDAESNLSSATSDLEEAQQSFSAAKNYYNTWFHVWEQAADEIREAASKA